MLANTHQAINQRLNGTVRELEPGRCTVEMPLVDEMAVDDRGLVHGGFIFGASDHAAMLAVNDPYVVLVAAEVKFLAPARVGETLRFEATVDGSTGKRRKVSVVGRRLDGVELFLGTFACAILEKHVLESKVR